MKMSSSQAVDDGVEIRHTHHLVLDLKRLLTMPSDSFSDLTLIVEGVHLKVHRVLLAARSEYFRALLYGGMKEMNQREIELRETDLAPFKVLLEYVYTGVLNLSKLKVEVLVGVLALANQYQFPELEHDMIFHMKNVLNESNVCSVYQTAFGFEMNDLTNTCAKFIDRYGTNMLESQEMLQLNACAIHRLLLRDSLCAREIEIFNMVKRWAAANDDPDGLELILSAVRWELLSNEELVTGVRESHLLKSEKILDILADKIRGTEDPLQLAHRGFLDVGTNVASVKFASSVIRGDVNNNSLLQEGEDFNYDQDRGSARHIIDPSEKANCIIVKLGMPCIINHIRFLLWDKDSRSYSYYVELSVDGNRWNKIVDYSSFLCRSWQEQYFAPCTVQFIKIVGTANSNGRYFNLVKLEASWLENIPATRNGIVVPVENVASVAKNAAVIEGVSRTRNALINQNSGALVYDWDNGYTCHQIGSGNIVIHFNQPYNLSSLRILLWDIDDRSYTYMISTSTNNRDWQHLIDTKNDPRRSWQSHQFPSRVCSFIRLTGLSNTANEVFHVVHLEAPDQSNPIAIENSAALSNAQPLNEPDVLAGNRDGQIAAQVVGALVAPHGRRSGPGRSRNGQQ